VTAADKGPKLATPIYLNARRYHRVHCAQGYARSCSQLADLLEQGLGGDADAKTASMYRQRACRLGFRAACAGETLTPTQP
jgi:TPR repeat protein